MLKNYFIIALRIFRRRPIYTLINVLGLSFGITCCLVTYMMLHHELTFDRFHDKKDNLYKVVLDYQADWGTDYISTVTYSLAPLVRQELPEFSKVLELQGPYENSVSFTDSFGNTNAFREEYVVYASDLFFDMFNFEILKGAGPEALKEPGKVFLTERLAEKYFGDENPIGQHLQIQKDSDVAEVVGIVKNPPKNTSTPFDMLISYETFRKRFPGIFNISNTFTWACTVYLEFADGHDQALLEEKLTAALRKHIPKDAEKYHFKLQPITEIHTAEAYGDGTHYVVPRQLVIGLIALAILLIGTSCLNFINLSTAQAVKRSKEVGVRKTVGGNKRQLVMQFLLETWLIVTLATLLAFTISQVFVSGLNANLSTIIPYDLQFDGTVIGFALSLNLLITILAGFYPALILAGYHPIAAIKNRLGSQKGTGSYLLRKALITTQFIFSTLLLSLTIIIYSQIRHINTLDLGFDQQDIVHVELQENILQNKEMLLFKEALQNKSYVRRVSASKDTPIGGGFGWNSDFKLPQNDYEDGYNARVKFVDEGFIDTYGIELAAGENLRSKQINDSTFYVLVNKKLISMLNLSPEEAIGFQFEFNGNLYGRILGVTEDFNSSSLKEGISPVILAYRPSFITGMSVKLDGKQLVEVREDLEATFHEFFPNKYFDHFLLEDYMQEAYTVENVLYKMVITFSILALVISVMGLYGLVTFMTERYAKMIGVRKVFGASTLSIILIFVKEYLLMLLIAFFIATPLAFLVGSEFVSEFAYQIQISPGYFALSFLLITLLAAGTVGKQAYLAATRNPISSLKYE